MPWVPPGYRHLPKHVTDVLLDARNSRVRIPPGTFLMGAGPDDAEAIYDERPQHEVEITHATEWFGAPLTQSIWELFGPKVNWGFKHPMRPVERISWYDAVRWCQVLTEREGYEPAYEITNEVGEWCGADYRFDVRLHLDRSGWRLPTEAEWERACRAGTTTPRYGPVDEVAWHGGNSGGQTQPVGEKEWNAWGLMDMLGNVEEWCWDWYGPYSPDRQTDPVGPATGQRRVLRGGSWGYFPRGCRSASRHDWRRPGGRGGVVGLRPVRSLP
jgi:formylglycine-generating enzyme required for sulfatase activity